MGKISKLGKFYTRIIMDHIGIFIFIGLLSVIFHDDGWMPNKSMYAIYQLLYTIGLPVLFANAAGKKTGDVKGGILAVLAVSGVLVSTPQAGLFGAMVLGPVSGMIWKEVDRSLKKNGRPEFQMLSGNMMLGFIGCILAAAGIYVFAPLLEFASEILGTGIQWLADRSLTVLLSIIVEPAKVFFLNNLLNHGILVPLALEQISETGSSRLFLIETNPGPGLGILCAMLLRRKKERPLYGSAILAEAVGGIHEVYFPFVLSNLKLLIPLIAGGMAGGLCFSAFQAKIHGVISPGSIITILLMSEKGSYFAALCGIFVSAAVSFLCSVFLVGKQEDEEEKREEAERLKQEDHMKNISKIYVVCDGGMGSSAMGAALLRRKLAAAGVTGVTAEACAADLLPEYTQLIVCQEDFKAMLPKQVNVDEVWTVESLVDGAEYEKLVLRIKEAKG